MQVVTIADFFSSKAEPSRYDKEIAEAMTLPEGKGLRIKHQNKYSAKVAATGMRSLAVSRQLPLEVRKRGDQVYLWKKY